MTFNHVTVRVPDVRKTSQFYQEFFGMPLKQHSDKTHILGVGKSFFGIEQKGTPAEGSITSISESRDSTPTRSWRN